MSKLKLFFLLYIIAVALIYALGRKVGVPFVLPGDIYIHKGTKRVYIPLASSLILTFILFLILQGFI